MTWEQSQPRHTWFSKDCFIPTNRLSSRCHPPTFCASAASLGFTAAATSAHTASTVWAAASHKQRFQRHTQLLCQIHANTNWWSICSPLSSDISRSAQRAHGSQGTQKFQMHQWRVKLQTGFHPSAAAAASSAQLPTPSNCAVCPSSVLHRRVASHLLHPLHAFLQLLGVDGMGAGIFTVSELHRQAF